jgi:eukaryotic-like serine/threonine-protein kinase
MTPLMALRAGMKLGRYEILELRGVGGMGEVYCARDLHIRRSVAIKIIPASLATDLERLQRFEHEVRTVGSLNHPGILTLYDFGVQDGSPYMVTELLQGQSLREQLRGGALPIRKAIDYSLQIVRGLAAAHDKNVVHRDVKPENIFITNDGVAKILDFGLAKLASVGAIAEDATQTVASDPGRIVGTVGYMSPEQVRGATVDARSDLFAFGATLYEMISGQRAFSGGSAADIMSAILHQDPPELTGFNHDVPPAIERIVRHCLEKNPEGRFRSAHDIAFDLESISTLSSSTSRSSDLSGTGRISLRHSWLLALFVVAVCIGAGIFLAKRSSVRPSQMRRLTFQRGYVYSARFAPDGTQPDFAPDGNSAYYSASWYGASVQTYTTKTDSVESRPLDTPNICLLSVSRAGEIVALSNPTTSPTGMIRGTLVRISPNGGAPRPVLEDVTSADWSPKGAEFAIARVVGGSQQIEFPAGNKLYQTAGWISDLRFSPTGDRLAFIEFRQTIGQRGTVVVLDLKTHTKIVSSKPTDLYGLAWSPDGTEVWFTSTTGDSVRAVFSLNMSGREQLRATNAGGIMIRDVAPDGRLLITRDDVRVTVAAFGPGVTHQRDLPWLDWSNPDDLSPDGKLLLFEEDGSGGGPSGSAWTRNTDGSPAIKIGSEPAAALSPDQRWAISWPNSETSKLTLLPIGTGIARSVEVAGQSAGEIESADWLPDQEHIIFVSAPSPNHGRQVFLDDLRDGKSWPVGPEGMGFQWPAHPVSPDGKRAILQNSDRVLFLVSLDEKREPIPLAGAERGEIPIRWSSDGNAIFLYRIFDTLPATVYRLDLSTGRRQPWKQLDVPEHPLQLYIVSAQITPNGKWYAFSYAGISSELYLMEKPD